MSGFSPTLNVFKKFLFKDFHKFWVLDSSSYTQLFYAKHFSISQQNFFIDFQKLQFFETIPKFIWWYILFF